MKNLDLKKYGVQEMNDKEMNAVDGGRRWWLIGAAAALGMLIAGPVGAVAGAAIAGATGL